MLPDMKRKRQVGQIAVLALALGLLSGCSQNLYNLHGAPPVYPQEEKAPPPGTIWPGATTSNTIFADNKARSINDIVTINFDENVAGTNNATTNTSRTTANTAGLAGITQANPSLQILSKYELGGSSTNSLKGDGATNRNATLTGKITARVMRILPNGNMAIEGRRQLTVNAEDQYIIISGIIRPDDITSENLIASSNISEARIYYTGKGVVDDKMRPGWLTRVVDWVWPF